MHALRLGWRVCVIGPETAARLGGESRAHLDRSTHLRKLRHCDVVPLMPQVSASTQPVGSGSVGSSISLDSPVSQARPLIVGKMAGRPATVVVPTMRPAAFWVAL